MIIIKNYFQGLPKELEEASHIDGASDLTIFLKVVLPFQAGFGFRRSVLRSRDTGMYFNSLLYIDNVNMKVAVQQVLREVMQQAQQAETDELMDRC